MKTPLVGPRAHYRGLVFWELNYSAARVERLEEKRRVTRPGSNGASFTDEDVTAN